MSSSILQTVRSSTMAFNGELLEILSWLNGKQVYKLSSVCKSFQEYLTEVFFAKKQSKNMLLFDDTDFFIESYGSPWIKPATRDGIRCNIPHESLEFLSNRGRIQGSSNGLICCRDVNDRDNNLLIFNPTSRVISKIALPKQVLWGEDRCTVFFSCEKDGDYFLMALVPPEDWGGNYSFMIYSHDEKIWKNGGDFNTGLRNINFKNYVYLYGVLYMISDTGGYITHETRFYWPYLIATETNNNKPSSSRFLAIPKNARKGVQSSKLRIFKWGSPDSEFKSICLVKLLNNVFTVWVMSGNNHIGPMWRQILKKRVKDMGIRVTDWFQIVQFTIWNGRSLLFATLEKVYHFDIEKQWSNGEAEELYEHACPNGVASFISFSSTLRPCGPDAISMQNYLNSV